MELKIIKTIEEYHAAIEFLELLGDRADFQNDQKLIREFELISTLVSLFEKENFPLKPGHPLEIIKLKMGMLGIQQKDLVPIIGSSGVVSEVLNRKRGLSKNMIRNFSRLLHIDQDILNLEYELETNTVKSAKSKKQKAKG